MFQTKTDMTKSTEDLIERLGLQDELQLDILAGILDAIKKLPLWKFPTKVHTIYVSAMAEVSDNDPNVIRMAKLACNERALTPPYDVEKLKTACKCFTQCCGSILNEEKYYCEDKRNGLICKK